MAGSIPADSIAVWCRIKHPSAVLAGIGISDGNGLHRAVSDAYRKSDRF